MLDVMVQWDQEEGRAIRDVGCIIGFDETISYRSPLAATLQGSAVTRACIIG